MSTSTVARLTEQIVAGAMIGLIFSACGDDVEVGSNDLDAVAGQGGASATGGASGGSGSSDDAGSCAEAGCQTHTYQCGDCLDNDGDGSVDSADPDCLGPCDNTEDSYYGGIPGQNNAPCRQDCYFDQDTGAGNDNCFWNHRCDPLSQPQAFPPSGDAQCQYDGTAKTPGTNASCDELDQAQAPECAAACGRLTPNGCDCFGCCELPARSGRYVWLGSTESGLGSCDAANVDDPARCKPCTPVSACLNDCAPCEICIGAAPDPGCSPDAGSAGSGGQCQPGAQPCGRAGQSACGSDEYCITGCCAPLPA